MMISMEIKFSLQIEVITIFGKKKFRSITYKNIIQSDHKKTPQLISFLFEIRFQRAVHQIKGFKKYYKLDIKCCP
jgi:hypothetical protein